MTDEKRNANESSAGDQFPEGNKPVVSPIYRTVKFTYPSIEALLSAEAKEHGFDYTRDRNPTTRQLELTAAELQDRDDAIAVASGMAAIWLAGSATSARATAS